MITSLLPAFNGGELSPLIHLRSDLEKYRAGCRTLENFLIITSGGVRRRAGLSYVETATTKCRLFRFQVSAAIGFILEFGEEYIRFYRDSEPVQSGGGDYVLASPYQIEDLDGVQSVQINNIAYFTHPNYPVRKLSRISDTSWTFVEVEFSYPGMMDENLRRGRHLSTPNEGQPGDSRIVNSDFDIFTEAHLGAYFQISHVRKPGQFVTSFSAKSDHDGLNSDPILIQGGWTFTTSGVWDGKFTIQRSDDDGATWKDFRVFKSNKDQNYSSGGDEPKLVLMRIHYNHDSDGDKGGARLEASSAYLRGLVRITDVINSQRVRADVIEAIQDGTTSYWREGAWSDKRGFPRTVCAHEQRVVYGGTAYQPQAVWASVVDDYENFQPGGTEDDDSWSHIITSDQQNDIQWMISQKSLLIGTSGDEWVMAASKEESIITPTNVRARRHSGNGSAFLKARLINDSVIFVQRGGKKVRNMTYDFSNDGYISTDLTILAEHITSLGVIDTAYQSMPESRLWCVTGNGELIGLTYDRAQSLSGWQRITTGSGSDGFESVAVKSVVGDLDQVWVSVRRTINGTVRRYIERMNEDGAFLNTPWSLLYASTEDVPLWDAGYSDYLEMDVVTDPSSPTGAVYYCILAYNTEENDEIPGINTDNWGIALDWDIETTEVWLVGNHVHRNGTLYVCIQDALRSVPAQWPGDDAGLYWQVITEFGLTPPEFKASNEYEEDTLVVKDFKPYKALSTHSAWDITPGEDPDFWELLQGDYAVGDLVSSNGVNYICTTAHTPSLATEPGVGAGDWGDYWEVRASSPNRFFVDSGVFQSDTGDISELAGLDHLEGETVQILANGFMLSERVVSGGKILFDKPQDPESFTSLSVGLQYESVLEPMAMEAGMDNGTSASREKRIHELVIYFHESGACKVASKQVGPFDTIPFRTGDSFGDEAQPLFTGAIVHLLESRHDIDASFVLKQDLPFPLTVLAVVAKWNIFGDQI